jgi:hypothetical protein
MANEEEIDEDDVQSEAGGSSESESSITDSDEAQGDQSGPTLGVVTVVGREPVFHQSHIVSERISTHGKIRPFEPIDQIPALNPNLKEIIGQVHGDGAIQKWLEKRAEWDKKYSSQHEKWREIKIADRKRAEESGFLTRQMHGERPPLCSLAGWYDEDKARAAGKSVDEISGKTSNMMMMWQRISQKVSCYQNMLTGGLTGLARQGSSGWRDCRGDQGRSRGGIEAKGRQSAGSACGSIIQYLHYNLSSSCSMLRIVSYNLACNRLHVQWCRVWCA